MSDPRDWYKQPWDSAPEPCGYSRVSQLGAEPCVMPKGHDGPHTCQHGARY